jgi:UDP-glucose-4-epimerase GalE
MTKILLTGGAGYIGSHTAKRLSQSGFKPVTLDDLSTGHKWAVKWGPFIQGDIGDQKLIREIVAEYHIQAVLHFAAHAYVGESITHPRKYFHNNVVRTLDMLNTLVDCSVKQVIFSSSCATYGDPQHIPIAESHPQKPVNPYGESKLMIERILHWYDNAYGLKAACLRYFNAAGADPDGEIGELHAPEPHLIPLVMQAASREIDSVSIFGTDYPTPDGTAIRDYTHVCDLADAHVLALEHLLKGGDSVELNLGTGRGHSVLEVIQAVEEVSGRSVPARRTARRPGDPPELVADANKAAEVLNWKPHFLDLRELIRTAWAWHAGTNRSN